MTAPTELIELEAKRRKVKELLRQANRLTNAKGSKYDARKAGERARQAVLSEQGRDVAETVHLPTDAEWRALAAQDFSWFCESYFQPTFYLPWSADHKKVIAKIEHAVLQGGLFAVATPRGFGKSSLCEAACLWAVLNGHRQFVVLIGPTEGLAEEALARLKTSLETNDDLDEHYSEVTGPIRALEGIANRCKGQLYGTERTHIAWTAEKIILPSLVPQGWAEHAAGRPFLRSDGKTLASGALLRVAGLTGALRGLAARRPDGAVIRPDLVLIDDPQTDVSAKSPSQCAERLRILTGAVLGLAGPGRRIAGVMPCTVIRAGDLADELLDKKRHPEWAGERTKMVYSFPTDTEKWDQYGERYRDGLRKEPADTSLATAFYREHQAAMDAGARVAWPERHYPEERSALQHAMSLRLRLGEAAFSAEYQNEPLPTETPLEELTAQVIMDRLNRSPRGRVPPTATRLTAFIDLSEKVLWYAVVAWEDTFGGAVIDYGTYPDQKRSYFTLRDAKQTLIKVTGVNSFEGSIYAGLEKLTAQLCGRDWLRADGVHVRLNRCLIDAHWGRTTELVYKFCRQSPHAAVLLPSHGRYIGAGSLPITDAAKKPGERLGLHWRLGPAPDRHLRRVIFDTNFWKSFLHSRLSVPLGEKGALTLWGDQGELHRLFSEQLVAEYRVRTEGRGRTVEEWHGRPDMPDNHFLDACVGAAVAASIEGAALPEAGGPVPRKRERRRVSLHELMGTGKEKR